MCPRKFLLHCDGVIFTKLAREPADADGTNLANDAAVATMFGFVKPFDKIQLFSFVNFCIAETSELKR